MHHPTDSIAHTTAFVTPVVEHWLEREIRVQEKQNNIYTIKIMRYTVIHSDLILIIKCFLILLQSERYLPNWFKTLILLILNNSKILQVEGFFQ